MRPEEEIQYIEIESQWDIGNVIKKGVSYSWAELIDIISDLDYGKEILQEEFEDYKEFVKDNYKQKTNEEIYGGIE